MPTLEIILIILVILLLSVLIGVGLVVIVLLRRTLLMIAELAILVELVDKVTGKIKDRFWGKKVS